jgi:hypothetical protein
VLLVGNLEFFPQLAKTITALANIASQLSLINIFSPAVC